MKFSFAITTLAVLTGSVLSEPCAFKQMDRIYYKDDKCTKIDYAFTKMIEDKYDTIKHATEKCGCNRGTGRCHSSTCTSNAVTFLSYAWSDKECQGEHEVNWQVEFNKCKDKMILHNKAAAGYVDPGFDTDSFKSVEESRMERFKFVISHIWNKIEESLTNSNDYDVELDTDFL